jgi:hypothetical protein
LLLAIVSVILLLFSGLVSLYKGNITILVDKEKLENAALFFLLSFLATVVAEAVATVMLL